MPLRVARSSLPVREPGCYPAGMGKAFAVVFGVGLVLARPN